MSKGSFKFNTGDFKKKILDAGKAAAEKHALDTAKRVLRQNSLSDVGVRLHKGGKKMEVVFSHDDSTKAERAKQLFVEAMK